MGTAISTNPTGATQHYPLSPAPMAQNHLYLVDGSGYIFRAYHQLPPLTNKHGQPVGAVYGYTTMLWKLAEELGKAEGPTHLAVVLDKGSHTFRNDMYDQYKANRPPAPEDLVPQFPMIRDANSKYQSGVPSGANTKIATIMTMSRKLVPQRG